MADYHRTWYFPYVCGAYLEALSDADWGVQHSDLDALSVASHLGKNLEFIELAKHDPLIPAEIVPWADRDPRLARVMVGGLAEQNRTDFSLYYVRLYKSFFKKHPDQKSIPYGPEGLEIFSMERTGEEPWYVVPVYNAFVRVINETENWGKQHYSAAKPRVVEILQDDAAFMNSANEEARLYHWPSRRLVENYVARYIGLFKNFSRARHRSSHSVVQLTALINAKKARPYNDGETKAILVHLLHVLKAAKDKPEGFQTAQTAAACVVLSLRDKGITHFELPKVHDTITWALAAMPNYAARIRPLLKEGVFDAAEGVSPMELSTTRLAGRKTGDIGSTQSARRRPLPLGRLDL